MLCAIRVCHIKLNGSCSELGYYLKLFEIIVLIRTVIIIITPTHQHIYDVRRHLSICYLQITKESKHQGKWILKNLQCKYIYQNN
jgi:hypothetical protein